MFFLTNIHAVYGGNRGGGVHVYFSNELMDRPAGKWIAFEEEVMDSSWGLELGFYDLREEGARFLFLICRIGASA